MSRRVICVVPTYRILLVTVCFRGQFGTFAFTGIQFPFQNTPITLVQAETTLVQLLKQLSLLEKFLYNME